MGKGDIKRIFAEHFDEFSKRNEDKIRPVVIKEVKKMLECGELRNGYIEYKCPKCGEIKREPFRCKSRFCNTCGKKYTEERAENMAGKLIRTGHRHMVFTIPEELREYFKLKRKRLAILPRCAAQVLKSWFKQMNKKEGYTPGIVTVIHTFGRDLKWNPHVHVLVTKGGAGRNREWKSVNYIPYKMLRLRWQKILLDKIEETIGKRRFKKIKDKLYKEKKEGFYVYGKGEVGSGKQAIKYVGRYTGRPVMAESRIKKYDGEKVTYWYERHEDGKRVEETIDAIEFIKRLVVHIPEKQFKMIRYYGIYTTQNRKGKKLLKMIDEKVQEIKKKMLTWRMQIIKSFGQDPLECEKCGEKMILYDIYYKEYGSMLEKYRRQIERKYEREIEETEKIYKTIKKVSNDTIEPLFAQRG